MNASISSKNKTIVITQHRLLHYRIPFFERLRESLGEKNISIRLVHGQASPREAIRADTGYLPWATKIENVFLPCGHRELVWQSFGRYLAGCDLLILMQENRLLSNYPYLMGKARLPYKIAFWGHGANFQSDKPDGILEQWKRIWLNRVDWWFAYTSKTVGLLESAGFPPEKISCINNTLDTESFEKEFASVTESERSALRKSLDIPSNSTVGLYCGSLYRDKRLDLLLDAAAEVRKRIPSFVLLVVGDGPERRAFESRAEALAWIKVVGAKKGKEKAVHFAISSLVLSPGAVGLHILDSFVTGVPLITTLDARHGPEIAYLKSGVNSIVCEGTTESFANSCINVLLSPSLSEALSKEARAASLEYHLDDMVRLFADGVIRCIQGG